MKGYSTLLVIMHAALSTVMAQDAYRCTTATAPIVVDGTLDSGEWASAPVMHLQVYLAPLATDMQQGILSQQEVLAYRDRQVHARALWDADALYLGFWADNPRVWNELSGNDAEGYFKENTLEWFIDPDGDGKDYLEFNLSTAGDVSDALLFEPNAGGFGFDVSGVEVATRVHGTGCASIEGSGCNADVDTGWSLEMRLPFGGTITDDTVPVERYWPDTLAVLQQSAPPPLAEGSVEDWTLFGQLLDDSVPEVPASVLYEALGAEAAEQVRTDGTDDAAAGDSLLAALNRIVADIGVFARYSSRIVLVDTLEATDPVVVRYRTALGMSSTKSYDGTVEPAWPLNGWAGTTHWEPLRADTLNGPDTTYVTGCPLVDTVVEYYLDTVVFSLSGMLMRVLGELVAAGALTAGTDGAYELTSTLTTADSVALQWLHVAMLEEVLFPGAVEHTTALRRMRSTAIDIAGGRSLPPNSGDQWNMNLYCLATRPCSTYQVTYTWANVNDIGTEYHQPSLFGTLEFVGTPAGVSSRPRRAGVGYGVQVLSRSGNQMVIRVQTPLSVEPHRVSILASDGRQLSQVSMDGGTDAVRVALPGLASGLYVVQVHGCGTSYRQAVLVP